ncbi:Vitamin K epoxide reductase [Enhygromyxa salina]|uniref:Vitamin K epoxide reductase n=1 Tax=Enhygromyxa salina TaxID=215803 RepID=A0A0C1ZBA2_9BACT|nr:vitamin K epoxide reductase family protein [Enhygromyxa salina]KIG14974.1 Vitamin K epoxide reductase [Enhygromyxa salina]
MLAAAATVGLVFAAFSTAEFAQHLDRQVHAIHCSFIPGAEEPAGEQASGCEVAMMSPYSSVLRTKIWGGLPIALPAMGIFAFLLWRALDLILRQQDQRKAAANFLIAASVIPVIASMVMGYIAATELHAACKICIGIYGSSAAVLIAAVLCRRAVVRSGGGSGAGAVKVWLTGAAQLGAFVAIPAGLYLLLAPDFSSYLGSCGALREQEDPYGVMIELSDTGSAVDRVDAIEIFDPLCAACRGFERRLDASEVESKLHRKAVLFPLDSTCNWMVSRSLHPGACTVSKAILCAKPNKLSPTSVIDWAFAEQEKILEASKADPDAAARMVTAQFPTLAACLGSAEVESQLNKSLRFAVRNSIPVLTPQLYVAGVKVCDEDTDLGLDWALARMLELEAAGKLRGEAPPAVPEPKLEAPTKPKAASKTRDKSGGTAKKETP